MSASSEGLNEREALWKAQGRHELAYYLDHSTHTCKAKKKLYAIPTMNYIQEVLDNKKPFSTRSNSITTHHLLTRDVVDAPTE
jgi:hypothetical protein